MKIDEADGDNNCNCSCGSLFTDSDKDQDEGNCKDRRYTWLDANGSVLSRKLTDYECNLEDEVQKLQDALFSISSHYAKIQFRLRQIACSTGNERLCLLRELERITCQGIDATRDNDEMPTLMSDAYSMGDVRVRQKKIITQLRSRLTDLAEVADSGFCIESESSYNLRKYVRADGTALCDITSDGKVEHGKYCACIICQENREEFSRVPACERGYLSETWPQVENSEYEYCECESKTRSKSKKNRKKRKEKKLDKVSNRKSSQRGSLKRYYRMSYEEKSPSQRNQQETLYGTATRGQSLATNSQRVTISSEKRSNQRSAHTFLNGTPRTSKSPSKKNPQSPSNASIKVRKSSNQRSPQASAYNTPSVDKSLNRKSRQESFTNATSMGKSANKRSEESFSSSRSRPKSLGPKIPQLSITGRSRIDEGLPIANSNISGNIVSRRRSSSEHPPNQESRKQSNADAKSLGNKDSYLSLRAQKQDKGERSSKASDNGTIRSNRRESFLTKLSNKLSRKSSKRASIEENPTSYEKDTDEDQNENRMSDNSTKRDQSRNYREGIKEDDQYEKKRSNKSSRVYQKNLDQSKSRNNEEDERSLRSYKWKQPLGYTYSNNNFSCQNKCGGNCAKSGQCGRIRECIKKYEEKEAKKCKAILKKCCALGYSQIHEPQQISPQRYQDFDRDQVENKRRSKRHSIPEKVLDQGEESHKRNGEDSKRGDRSIRGSLKEEFDQQRNEIRTNRKASKNRETVHPVSPEGEYEQDRSDSEQNSNLIKDRLIVNVFGEELDEDQSKEKSKRSSILSKKENESIRSSFQEELDQYGEGSRRSSKSKRSTQEAIDQNGKESRRSSAIKDGWIPQDELDRDREESRRNSKGNEQPRSSFKDKDKVDSEAASSKSFNTSEETHQNTLRSSQSEYPKDQIKNRIEDKSTASPYSTRSMVEMTTNIERDNTNRTSQNKIICQRPRCKGKCIKTVEFVECPYKNKHEKTEICYTPERPPKPQQNSSRNRSCDLGCKCVKSQTAHYQLLRPFSQHSMLELPLVYPHAIGKPRNITKCDRRNCKDASIKGQKHFEGLSQQNKRSSNNSDKMNTNEIETPSTSTKRSKLTEDLSDYKDPIEENAQTDC